jgi:putative membrane protein
MAESPDKQKPVKSSYIRDHMANERTFLAWIRTSIGIMAFGFVVEKFALFIRKLGYFFGKSGVAGVFTEKFSYSTAFGIVLVALGALMGLLAFIRYKKVQKEIDAEDYKPSIILDILVAMGILAIGIFLVFYMVHSIHD